jgi:hypothetical protein
MTSHVDRLVEKVCAQHDEKVARLEWLLQNLADDQFATGAEDLDHFAAAYGQAPEGRPREILACLNRLLGPVEFGAEAEAETDGDWKTSARPRPARTTMPRLATNLRQRMRLRRMPRRLTRSCCRMCPPPGLLILPRQEI